MEVVRYMFILSIIGLFECCPQECYCRKEYTIECTTVRSLKREDFTSNELSNTHYIKLIDSVISSQEELNMFLNLYLLLIENSRVVCGNYKFEIFGECSDITTLLENSTATAIDLKSTAADITTEWNTLPTPLETTNNGNMNSSGIMQNTLSTSQNLLENSSAIELDSTSGDNTTEWTTLPIYTERDRESTANTTDMQNTLSGDTYIYISVSIGIFLIISILTLSIYYRLCRAKTTLEQPNIIYTPPHIDSVVNEHYYH